MNASEIQKVEELVAQKIRMIKSASDDHKMKATRAISLVIGHLQTKDNWRDVSVDADPLGLTVHFEVARPYASIKIDIDSISKLLEVRYFYLNDRALNHSCSLDDSVESITDFINTCINPSPTILMNALSERAGHLAEFPAILPDERAALQVATDYVIDAIDKVDGTLLWVGRLMYGWAFAIQVPSRNHRVIETNFEMMRGLFHETILKGDKDEIVQALVDHLMPKKKDKVDQLFDQMAAQGAPILQNSTPPALPAPASEEKLFDEAEALQAVKEHFDRIYNITQWECVDNKTIEDKSHPVAEGTSIRCFLFHGFRGQELYTKIWVSHIEYNDYTSFFETDDVMYFGVVDDKEEETVHASFTPKIMWDKQKTCSDQSISNGLEWFHGLPSDLLDEESENFFTDPEGEMSVSKMRKTLTDLGFVRLPEFEETFTEDTSDDMSEENKNGIHELGLVTGTPMIFAVIDTPDGVCASFSTMHYWQKHGCLYDQHLMDTLVDVYGLPEDEFDEVAENCFLSNNELSVAQFKARLLELGFVNDPGFQAYMDTFQT